MTAIGRLGRFRSSGEWPESAPRGHCPFGTLYLILGDRILLVQGSVASNGRNADTTGRSDRSRRKDEDIG
jgi:hypothetical protein